MVFFFWLNQQWVREGEASKSSLEGEKKVWSLLIPHLTEKGLKAFKDFFGEAYLQSLGKSFKSDIGAYLKI